MEMEKKFKKIEQEKFEISEVSVVTDKEEQYIQQIRFKVGENDFLTYKPTKTSEKEFKFLKIPVVKKELKSLTLEEMPKKIMSMNEILLKDKIVYIVTDYNLMTVQNEEEETKTYKFLNNSNFESLRIVDKFNKELYSE